MPETHRRSDRRRRRSSAGFRGGWSSARAPWAAARIIGDARSPKMQEVMNLKIKFRESFRPFAPSVLREKRRASGSSWTARAPTCCWSRRWPKSRQRAMTRRGAEAVRPGEAADACARRFRP
ncbi:MAG: hypothetical protein M0C28_13650 [Candidatus Moduliflexus flocculans]|nr:hypothetical protein [Candidatus Moduliflexus flocculans]